MYTIASIIYIRYYNSNGNNLNMDISYLGPSGYPGEKGDTCLPGLPGSKGKIFNIAFCSYFINVRNKSL